MVLDCRLKCDFCKRIERDYLQAGLCKICYDFACAVYGGKKAVRDLHRAGRLGKIKKYGRKQRRRKKSG